MEIINQPFYKQPVKIPQNSPPCYHPERFSGVCEEDLHTLTNIQNCMVYIWLKSSEQFWFYVLKTCHTYVKGFAWLNGWVYVRIALNEIESYY